jgi:hypothetical protein
MMRALLIPFAPILLTPALSFGCGLIMLTEHDLDPAEQGIDVTPPHAPAVFELSITRGRGPQRGCGGETMATSCDDIGLVTLSVSADDDRTAKDETGYRIELASGKLPDGLLLPEQAVRASGGGQLTLHWADGATDDQEAIDFSLAITAVDLAGNESTTATTVKITDAGGFMQLARRLGPRLPLVALLFGLAMRRRAFRRRMPATAIA